MVAYIFTQVSGEDLNKVISYRVKKGFGFCDNAMHNKGTNCKCLNVGTQNE